MAGALNKTPPPHGALLKTPQNAIYKYQLEIPLLIH
jgi:hypothetical protein